MNGVNCNCNFLCQDWIRNQNNENQKVIYNLNSCLAVLIITVSCATTPETKEEREYGIQEVFLWAVKRGNIAKVKRFIDEGANVNAQSNEGWSALMEATRKGHIEIATLLREAGAVI